MIPDFFMQQKCLTSVSFGRRTFRRIQPHQTGTDQSRKNKPNISRLNPTSENLQLKIKARKCHPVAAVCSAGAFIHPSCRRGYASFRSKLILSSRPGRGIGITGVWSSCWLGSARPQWSACGRVAAIVSVMHSCTPRAGEKFPSRSNF